MINKQMGMMQPNTRMMIQKIADGRPALFKILFLLYQSPRCNEIFQRMIDNKITGEKFGQALGDFHHDLPLLVNHIMR